MSDKNTELYNIAKYCGGETKYKDGYKCLCPLHKDKTPSLLLNLSYNGNIVATCFAGCNWQDLLEHFRQKGLMLDSYPQPSPNSKTNTPKAKAKTTAKDIITDTYHYVDSIGIPVFEKQRLEPEDMKGSGVKRFLYRRQLPNSNKWIYKDVIRALPSTIPVPLYQLPRIFKADTIYICEGEKDAKEILKHLPDGSTATCNHDGAGKWLPHYNTWLKGKICIILQDNDDSGDKHTKLLTDNLADICKLYVVTFKEYKDVTFPRKYDVSNFLTDYGYPELVEYIDQNKQQVTSKKKVKEIEKTQAIEKKEKKDKTEVPRAMYEDYISLTKKVLGDMKVDIFSEDLVYQTKDVWQPVKNALGIVKSEAEDLQVQNFMKYKDTSFINHIDKYESKLKPQLLIDIPLWDKEDRIGHMASCLLPSESQGFTQEDFDQLVTDWLVKAYQRTQEPSTRQRMLILNGDQHIGKDWWIESLLCGAGQFLKDLHVNPHDKDTFLQLSQGWFLRIGEFDKTARLEVSVLKEMVTKPYTDIRAPYDRAGKRRYIRCSFISGSNIKDLLRDPTGATRYLILEVDRIKYEYPVRDPHFGLQILAQARHLAETGFQCNPVTEQRLAEYLRSQTPDDPYQMLPELYLQKVPQYINSLNVDEILQVRRQGRMTFPQAQPLIAELAKMLEIRTWTAQNILNHKKIAQKVGGMKYYFIPEQERIQMNEDIENENDEDIHF